MATPGAGFAARTMWGWMKSCSILTALAAAGAILLAGAPGAKAACSMSAAPIAVEMKGLTPTVPVKVNGKDLTFLVDSGAFFNTISAQFAFDQKMRKAQTATAEIGSHFTANAETYFSGVGGRVKVSALVQADEFQFAGVNFRNAIFLTASMPMDGLIGQSLLRHWDVEYDFHDAVMKLVDVQGCKDVDLAYWVKSGTYSMMPLEHFERGDEHTTGWVFINGVKMRAIFDTGAGSSFITRRAASRAGVEVTDPGVQEAGYSRGLDRDRIKTWVGRFASVKIADEEIKNGRLKIGQTEVTSFDVLIGADFFRAHHIYVANSQQKIYFSYSGGQVFNLAPEDEAAAASGGNTAGPAR